MSIAIDLNTKELLTTEEAAAYTGLEVETIRDYCNSGILEHYKPANRIFIERTALLAWMRSSKVESANNLSMKAYRHDKNRKAS